MTPTISSANSSSRKSAGEVHHRNPEIPPGITRKDILRYIGEEYTRDNIVISVCGSFNEEHVCELFDCKLTALNEKKTAKAHAEAEYKPSYKVKVKDIEQSHICLGLKGLSLDDDRYYSLVLLNNIMGGSMSSRLFQNIGRKRDWLTQFIPCPAPSARRDITTSTQG
jgi:predicted Zn-dependent peptidase